jgi:hypothetical protein
MTAILKVDTIQDTAGNNIINESSDTITIGAAGDIVTVPGTEVKSNKLSPASGTALQIGDSGDTITIPSGATITNSGTASGFGGITNAQQWRISAAQSNMNNGDHVTNNWEVADSFGYGGIGSAMSQSSGIFTFPSTGIWLVQFTYNGTDGSAQDYVGGIITSTTNNSSYGEAVKGNSSIQANGYFTGTINFMFDVTSTSTHKVRFAVHCETGQIALSGDTNRTDTGAVFIRLGDT